MLAALGTLNWTAIIITAVASVTAVRVADKLVVIAKIWLKGVNIVKEANEAAWRR